MKLMIWSGYLRSRISFYFPTAIFIFTILLDYYEDLKVIQGSQGRLLEEVDAEL